MNSYSIASQHEKLKQIVEEIEKVIIGKREVVRMLLIALLSGGHVLIEDVPGVGKTTLATALGKATGLECKRAQFTPDVMASDITGFTMFNKELNKFEFRQGLVMCNILLADEINRTSPKTQSALLEAMEERSVTVDGTAHKLPAPFMVIATQNEVGYVGTFPLPEAQLDRFMMKISMGYPTIEEEMDIISGRRSDEPLKNVKPICTAEDIMECMETVKLINLEQSVYRYIVELVAATRKHPSVLLGASPRASLALMRASQTYAYLSGRTYVVPEDVIKMVPFILAHRMQLTQEAKIKRTDEMDVLKDIAQSIKPPLRKNEG